MDKSTLIWIALGVALASVAYFRAGAESGAKQALADGARVIDVRTPEEYASGHLERAINIPVHELDKRLAEAGPKDASIVVYCRSGQRSARAKKILNEAGFQKVFDLGAMGNGK